MVETIDQTKNQMTIDLSEISRKSGTTPAIVERILRRILGPDKSSRLETVDRFTLASEAARLGMIQEVARALTWQEFETFTGDCLLASGFETKNGVIVRDAQRRWQIDITAKKGAMILAFDCKHWESPNYTSKFKKPAEHQRLAVTALLDHMKVNGELAEESWALPIILTLFDPRRKIFDGVTFVSVGQLPDFLQHVTPYESELPFIKAPNSAESPIS